MIRCDRTAAWAALKGHFEAHGRDLDLPILGIATALVGKGKGDTTAFDALRSQDYVALAGLIPRDGLLVEEDRS